METRPKINVSLSPLDKILESTGKLLIIIIWGLTLFVFFKLPALIPTHFNASGQPDDYGNKLTILILPIIATLVYLGLTKLNQHPHTFNYINSITEDNAEKQFTIATRMLRVLKIALLIIFSHIILFTYLTSSGVSNGLGVGLLPFTLGIVLIPIIFYIVQSIKKNKVS
jgi:uncharacterized membrane protein